MAPLKFPKEAPSGNAWPAAGTGTKISLRRKNTVWKTPLLSPWLIPSGANVQRWEWHRLRTLSRHPQLQWSSSWCGHCWVCQQEWATLMWGPCRGRCLATCWQEMHLGNERKPSWLWKASQQPRSLDLPFEAGCYSNFCHRLHFQNKNIDLLLKRLFCWLSMEDEALCSFCYNVPMMRLHAFQFGAETMEN